MSTEKDTNQYDQEFLEDYEAWINDNLMDSSDAVSPEPDTEKPPDEEVHISMLEKMRGDGKREAIISNKKSYKTIFSAMIIFLSLYLVIMFTIKTRFNPITVVGSSMSPTYENGDILRTTTRIDETGIRYDTIICFKKENKTIIKRVVGLPGDTISFKDGKVYINGKLRKEKYPLMTDYPKEEIKLKDDEYYCLGDNRNHSKDSRVFGPIKRSEITGIVLINSTKEKERFKEAQRILQENMTSPTDATLTDTEKSD